MEETVADVANEELLKILAIAVGLLGSQALFNGIGVGGFYFMAFLYTVVSMFSGFVVFDSSGVKPEEKKPFSPLHSVTRVVVNLSVISIGLLTWMIIGAMNGVQVTFENAKPPEEVVQQMVGDSLPLKVLMTFISHLTLYSFTRFWMNFWDLLYGMWKGPEKLEKSEKSEKPENPKKKK